MFLFGTSSAQSLRLQCIFGGVVNSSAGNCINKINNNCTGFELIRVIRDE